MLTLESSTVRLDKPAAHSYQIATRSITKSES